MGQERLIDSFSYAAHPVLNWDDFRARPEFEGGEILLTTGIWHGYVKRDSLVILAIFNPDKSKVHGKEKSSRLLLYFQTEWNMNEKYVRMVRHEMSLIPTTANKDSTVKSLISRIRKLYLTNIHKMAVETQLGENKQQMDAWVKRISQDLELLKDYQ